MSTRRAPAGIAHLAGRVICTSDDFGDSAVAPWQTLRVGDRIRPISVPSEWLQPGYHLPVETLELWSLLISRCRPIRIYEVDEWGSPWVRCRVRAGEGSWVGHHLAITHDGWVHFNKKSGDTP